MDGLQPESAAVTVDGVTYQPALCGTSNCDPRGIGLNPILSQIWEKYMPLPNNPDGGDQYNTQGFRSQIPMPVKSNFLVARVDRDLHPKHRLMLSYRYFHLYQSTTSQVDIGGFFRGQYPRSTEILDGQAADSVVLHRGTYQRAHSRV